MTDLAKIRALAQAILDEAADPVPPPPPPDPIPDPVPPPPPPVPDPVPPSPPIGGLTVAKDLADLTARLKALGPGAHKIGLAKGTHGRLTVSGVKTGGLVEIIAEEADAVILDRVRVQSSADVAIRGMKVIPQADIIASNAFDYAFRADSTTQRVEFDRCTVWGRSDAPNHTNWSKADWQARAICGFQLEGPDSEVYGCTVMAGRFGFYLGTQAVGSRILSSKGEGLSHDGIRLTGNGQRVAYNRVSDLVKIDGNHPDMVQAHGKRNSDGSFVPLDDIVIEDNTLLEWAIRGDNPLQGFVATGIRGPQGIFLGNGPYVRPIVRRNKVATGHYHGITINNGQGSTCEDNIVWNPNYAMPGIDLRYPWISLKGSITAQSGNVAPQFTNQATGTKTDYANLPVV